MHFDPIIELLFLIDQCNLEMDMNKMGIMRVWNRLLDIDETTCCNAFSNLPKPSLNALINFSIVLLHTPPSVEYNQTILPMFYRLLYCCAKHDCSFLLLVLNSKNFQWGVAQLYLSPHYPAVGEPIFELMRLSTNCTSATRASYTHLILTHNRMQFSYRNAIRLLSILLITEDDLAFFCRNEGPYILSQYPDLSEDIIELDPEALNAIQDILKILIKATDWLLGDHLLATHLAEQWDSKLALLPPLRFYLDSLVNDQILTLVYSVLFNLSQLDEIFLDNLMQYLLQEHENYHAMINAPEEDKYLFQREPRRPAIKAHLPGNSSQPFEHECYFLFVSKLCSLGLTQQIQTNSTLAAACVQLIILVTIETISMRYIHSLFVDLLRQVLKSPHSSLLQRSSLDSYIVLIFTSNLQALDIAKCYMLLLQCFDRDSQIPSELSEETHTVICTSLLSHTQSCIETLKEKEFVSDELSTSLIRMVRAILVISSNSVSNSVWVSVGGLACSEQLCEMIQSKCKVPELFSLTDTLAERLKQES